MHVTTVHPAYDARILRKECGTLASAGYDVHLVAQRCSEVENAFGVTLHDLPYQRSRKGRIRILQRAVLTAVHRVQPDVVHLHDPELLPLGWLLRLLRYQVVFDAHEDVPDDIRSKTYLPRVFRRPFAICAVALVAGSSRVLSGVVAATPHIAHRFRGAPTVVVRNFSDVDELTRASQSALPYTSRPKAIVYSGVIAEVRGISNLVRAVNMLPERHADARLLLLGTAHDPNYRDALTRLDVNHRVDMVGFLPYPEMIKVVSNTRIGTMLALHSPNHEEGLPTKLFEYMSLALPLVASDLRLTKSVVDWSRCGVCVDPLDIEKLADSITWMLDHPEEAYSMGVAGQLAAGHDFNWRNEGRALIAFYQLLQEGKSYG